MLKFLYVNKKLSIFEDQDAYFIPARNKLIAQALNL
jgi:hypothetical protein